MMPKGVEHYLRGFVTTSIAIVFPSMMPKGVEHVLDAMRELRKGVGVSFNDAERR